MRTRKHSAAKIHVAFAASSRRMAVVLLLSAGSALHLGAQMSMPTAGVADGASTGMQDSMTENSVFVHARLDQFEGRTNGSASEFRWDGEGWIGTDMNKLWIKSEGFSDNSTVSDGDHEALYDRPIPRLRYFDAQAGVRADLDSDPHRAWAALGVEGLAPGYFEFAPTFYIRDSGNIAGRLTGFYDLLLTQRWIVQPEAELNFYNKDDPGRRIGSGLSDLDAGLRLRYEISRKFAPYIGFAYNGKYGNTANYSRQAGETTGDARFLFGIRLWY
jgi:copper resistance protein B